MNQVRVGVIANRPGGSNRMSEKLVPQLQQEPRVLTVSQIHVMVMEIAEDLAQRMSPSRQQVSEGTEPLPIDNMDFIRLMSPYLALN